MVPCKAANPVRCRASSSSPPSRGFSDVHLGVGEEPRYRDRGEMLRTGWPVTEAAGFQTWLREMLSPAQVDAFQRDKEFDGSHAFPFVRVRINLLESLRGPAMVLRLIPQTIATLEELASKPKGLVLITGPTGSGKSTTLAAMIDWINRNRACHILTIEDPVEFVHSSQQSLISHREGEAAHQALSQRPQGRSSGRPRRDLDR